MNRTRADYHYTWQVMEQIWKEEKISDVSLGQWILLDVRITPYEMYIDVSWYGKFFTISTSH